MKRTLTIVVAVISALLLTGPVASADKGGNATTKGAKGIAAKQCAALKNADRAAFKSTYAKPSMRTCVRALRGEAADIAKNASEECKAEAAADPEAFAAAYGTKKDAHGKCVSSKVQAEMAAVAEGFKNAAKECKAERALDRAAFTAKYGTGKSKGKNALGKCVSQKAKDPTPDPDPDPPPYVP